MDTKKRNFWDRESELGRLHEIHNRSTAAFVKIWGRRRVGKTELIRHFLSGLPGNSYLYFFVNEGSDETRRVNLQQAISQQLGDTLVIHNWEFFFDYIAQRSKKRFVLVIDEAPRFMYDKSSFLTSLQHAWDTNPGFKNTNLVIILVGSSISMMEQMTSRNGPLYGRITDTIKVSPFRYTDFRTIFSGMSEHEMLQSYSVFGGTPHYIRFMHNNRLSLRDAISKFIVTPGSALADETHELFEIENIHEPGRYVSILQAIGGGHVLLSEIADILRINQEQIPQYLDKLDHRLDLLEKANPISGKKKSSRYIMKDNFFRFWYKFIYPNRSAIELGNTKDVEELISRELPGHVGHVFESVVRELLVLHQGKRIGDIEVIFDEIGSWWPRRGQGDIDVIAYHQRSQTFIIADVKCDSRPYHFTEWNILKDRISTFNQPGNYRFMVVSKSGFTKEFKDHAVKNNIVLIDLARLSQLFDSVKKEERNQLMMKRPDKKSHEV